MSTTTTEPSTAATKTARYLAGQVVQYDIWTVFNSTRAERIRPGAFDTSLQNNSYRVPLLLHHNKDQFPVGSLTAWRNQTTGLWAKFRMADTPEADVAYSMVSDGHMNGVSVSFVPNADWTQSVPLSQGVEGLIRWKLRLTEVSIVNVPAYERARIHVSTADEEPDDGPSESHGPRDLVYYQRALDQMRNAPVQRALDGLERVKDEQRKQRFAELKEWSDAERLWKTAKMAASEGVLESTRRHLRAGKIRGSWDYE